MINLVQQRRDELARLCGLFRIERLSLFGSAATGAFSAESSDLDFLVSFADRQPSGEYADRYLDFADALENLFHRHVDLVTEQSLRNPYFRNEVDETRQVIYEQPRQETAL